MIIRVHIEVPDNTDIPFSAGGFGQLFYDICDRSVDGRVLEGCEVSADDYNNSIRDAGW